MADNMTPSQRSLTMSRIRSRDTVPELVVRRLLHARGLRYRTHLRTLPGKPDLVFRGPKVAVFVDGDFWHGWRFSRWREVGAVLAGEDQSEAGRSQRPTMRREGWTVIRLWEHDIEADPSGCADRVETAVRSLGTAEKTPSARPSRRLSATAPKGET